MAPVTVPSGRVVVTGMGAVTPLGTGLSTFWPRLIAGESGIGTITLMDVGEYTTRIAGEVNDFQATDYVGKKEARRIDRFISFAVAASSMAIEDAAFPEDEQVRTSTGVLIGSGIGGLTTMVEQTERLFNGGPSKVSPFLVPYMIPDMASGYVSILNGLRGPNTCVVSACATGTNAIGDAYHMIKRGDAVAMVAGGTEAPINAIGMSGFCAARAMSTRNDEPERASRPFDADRDGFVIAEGAGVLILEDYEFAKKRGAKMYAEIVGYGMSGDAYHITAPDPKGRGAYRSMEMAMDRAGVSASDVSYINAHGTSTDLNDKLETAAVKRLLGEVAYKVPISSSKSMLGHMLGAAGAVEAVICIMAIEEGVIPPTINYQTPDPECDLDYVPNEARKAQVTVAMSNSFGFGGHNATLIFRKVGD
ncbi:MAG: beta-ketoacyl-ACP synthase II [Armatimonadetes bacterium]|nr:beta-ketoacyl-ACP synthase II [Armatimonadota bacterium]